MSAAMGAEDAAAAARTLLHSSTPERLAGARTAAVLSAVLGNLARAPGEPRYRALGGPGRPMTATVARALGCPGAEAVLLAAGFQQRRDGGGTAWLEVPAEVSAADVTAGARAALEGLGAAFLDAAPAAPYGKVGLRNRGNTCFMNAGLQCLCHVAAFAGYFLSASHALDCEGASQGGPKGELARAVAELLVAMWQGAVRRHDPEALQQRLAELAPHLLAGGEQQDVQEFLSFFIDGLHADLDRVASPPPPLSEEDERRDARLAEERGEEWTAALAWMRHLERSKSFLVDLLQGQVRSTLRCTRCGHKSRCFDPFLYLSVPVARSTHTLDDAIRLYLDEELLTGGDRWRCPKCETLVDATKKIDLWKLPPVLVLHLKRFEFDRRSLQIRKVDHRVDVPLELNLLEHCSSSQKEGAVYELACVANHRGAFGGGHYTATCRVGEGPERQWYCFDDERVFPLPAGRQVVTEEAYVVFFELRPSSRPREGAAAGRRAPARQSLASPQDWPHQIVRMRTLQSAARARAGAPGAGPPPPGPRGAAPSAQAAGAAAAAEPREPRSGRAAEEAKGRGAEPAPPGPLGEPSLSGARGCEGGADGGGLLGAWVPPLFGARGCEDDAEGGGLLGAWLHTREPSEGSPWVRRWCVLHRDALRFSVDSGGVEEAGEIALGEEVAMERLEGGSCSAPRGAPYTFLLHPGGPAQAPCMLAAEDGETFRAWRVAVENLAGRGGAARNDEVCCAAS